MYGFIASSLGLCEKTFPKVSLVLTFLSQSEIPRGFIIKVSKWSLRAGLRKYKIRLDREEKYLVIYMPLGLGKETFPKLRHQYITSSNKLGSYVVSIKSFEY